MEGGKCGWRWAHRNNNREGKVKIPEDSISIEELNVLKVWTEVKESRL